MNRARDSDASRRPGFEPKDLITLAIRPARPNSFVPSSAVRAWKGDRRSARAACIARPPPGHRTSRPVGFEPGLSADDHLSPSARTAECLVSLSPRPDGCPACEGRGRGVEERGALPGTELRALRPGGARTRDHLMKNDNLSSSARASLIIFLQLGRAGPCGRGQSATGLLSYGRDARRNANPRPPRHGRGALPITVPVRPAGAAGMGNGDWMAAPERRPRGHGGADGNVLADNRALRPGASGVRLPEITVRYRPARPTGSAATGFDRIDHSLSDPGRAQAATLWSSYVMPCSVEAGPMGTRT